MFDFRVERTRLNDESNENIRRMQSNIDKVVAVGKMYNTDVQPLVVELQKELAQYKSLITTAMGRNFVCEILNQCSQVVHAVGEANIFAKKATLHYLRDSLTILKMCGEIE